MIETTHLPDYLEDATPLGAGPHAYTYSARDRRTGRPVVARRFRREAWFSDVEVGTRNRAIIDALAPQMGLAAPRVPVLLSVDEIDGAVVAVRDEAPGIPLCRLLERRGTLTLPEAAEVAEQAGAALDALWAAGFVHGAVHAGNIIVDHAAGCSLTDPTVGRLLSEFTVAGRSCHVVRRRPYRDDLAALSAVMFEAIAGYSAFRHPNEPSDCPHLPRRARHGLRVGMLEGRGGFERAEDLALVLRDPVQPSLFHFAWRPAAGIGLLAALATVPGSALSTQRHEALPRAAAMPTSVAVHVAPATIAPAPAPLDLSDDDMQVLQLAIRRQGAAVLSHRSVADVFGLSQDQSDRIAECMERHRLQAEQVVAEAMKGGAPDTGTMMAGARVQMNAEIIGTLTAEQRAQWQQVAGQSQHVDAPTL